MNARYEQERQHQNNLSKVAGAALVLIVHGLAVMFGAFTGIKYLWPPPDEQSFLIEFEELEETVRLREVINGRRPQSEDPDITKPLDLVQASEAQLVGHKPNEARESVVDDHGDVETYQPEREEVIDNRSLFTSAKNVADKDTLAAQTASKVSDALKTGHPDGNTKQGKTTGEPNAHLEGRTALGSLAKPSYNVAESGIVVVTIWVDQYGNVKKAQAGEKGTTVVSDALWNAARIAAMESHFNMDGDAPPLQQGTITYKFNITNK